MFKYIYMSLVSKDDSDKISIVCVCVWGGGGGGGRGRWAGSANPHYDENTSVQIY